MDIKKFKEEVAKMPEQGFKGNMFVSQKKPAPKTPIIRELAKKWGLPVKEYKPTELEDVDKIQPLEKIDENAPTTKFDTQAFFANKQGPVVMYLDEISINGLTGETFTNEENN